MKKLFSFLLPVSLLFAFRTAPHTINEMAAAFSDSGKIQHTMDGLPTEWPADRFQTDADTHISYAFDNDENDLYVVMKIADMPEQMKLMRMGMRLFIDLKAKKKENMGIEFPVKRDPTQGGGFSGGGGSRPPQGEESGDGGGDRRKFDIKAMRERMALNMVSMKTFGFEGQDEPKEIGLTMFNKANLVYNWDSLEVMSIEYKIPLGTIDDIKSLDNKNITIGWKIFGVEIPSGGAGAGGGAGGGFPGGGRSSGGRPGAGRTASGGGGGGSTTDRQANFEKMREEQSLWGKYTFVFDKGTKGF
jgi:hypothetical protein